MEEPTDPNFDLIFYDALDSFEHQQQTLDSPPPPPPELIKAPPADDQPPLDAPQPPSFRRRRSSRFPSDTTPDERRNNSRILRQLRDAAAHPEASTSDVTIDGTIHSRDEAVDSPSGGFLLWIAGFVIKAIFFQLNTLIASFFIPVKLLHFSFLMVTDPFGTVKRAMNAVKERFLGVWNGVIGLIDPWVSVREQGMGKLAVRVAMGCFWAVYVGFILFGLLVTAFLGGSLVMKRVVEEPLRMERALNFDYTKPSPDALVAIDSKGSVDCHDLVSGVKDGFGKEWGSRVVPANHKLQLVISLTLPESDYNRKLGIFQVSLLVLKLYVVVMFFAFSGYACSMHQLFRRSEITPMQLII